MGINSTEVSYGFGQLGSAFQNIANKPVYPPKGLVIVAVQFLSSNKLVTLDTEIEGTSGAQYITTATSEAQDNNYLGVTEAAIASATLTDTYFTNDTVQISTVNSKIKKGQYVLMVNDTDAITTGLTVDSVTPTPIYNGINATGVTVKKVNGVYITLSKALTFANAATTYTLVFLDEHHGAGSTDVVEAIFPTGMVIYGRWTKVVLANSDSAGGMICYFGK